MSSRMAEEQFSGITPADVRWCALGRGWKSQPSRNPAVVIFYKLETEFPIQVPQRSSRRDVALVMEQVLRKLAEIEERQLDEVSITPPEEDSVLQVELSWSPVRPQRSIQIPNFARFAAPDLGFIQNAGKRLREKTFRHDTVEGRIVSLREQPMLLKDLGRTVEIRAHLDDRASTVRFGLDEKQYREACDAYRDKKSVRLTGTLRRDEKSKSYDVRDVESFEILP